MNILELSMHRIILRSIHCWKSASVGDVLKISQNMATKAYLSHVERTVAEPRDEVCSFILLLLLPNYLCLSSLGYSDFPLYFAPLTILLEHSSGPSHEYHLGQPIDPPLPTVTSHWFPTPYKPKHISQNSRFPTWAVGWPLCPGHT